MSIILLTLGLAVGLFGFLVLLRAESAIHEIESFILFLISAVFISGAAIADGLKSLLKKG